MEDTESVNPISILTIPHWKTVNGRLPIDSLVHVWARLPLKTLFKSRSVCKLWNSTIASDPLLPNLRHNLSLPPSPNLLIFLELPNKPIKVPDRPVQISLRPVEDVVIHGSDPKPYSIRNGFTPYSDYLLDILPSKGPVVCFVSGDFFYLCNPSTQEFLRVSRVITHGAGFGYLSMDNRYILTRLSESGRCEFLDFGPGCAGSASWRVIKSNCPFRVRGYGVMVDGSFYWTITHDTEDEIGLTRNDFVVCLDTKEEKFRVVSRPEGNDGEVILYDQMYLVEFKGSLCAVDNKSRPSRMEIWVMSRSEWEFTWVRKYNIFISGMGDDLVHPFCDFEGESGGEMVLCSRVRIRLYRYNLKKRSINVVFKSKNSTIDQLAVYNPGLFPLSIARDAEYIYIGHSCVKRTIGF